MEVTFNSNEYFLHLAEDVNTSTQTDVILYEIEQCPIFSINDTTEATYIPCEGVVAIGEVKSTLTTTDLKDSINKMKC